MVVPKHKKDANGNIDYQNYEDLDIDKKDNNGNGINGIKFCIAKDPKDITKWCYGNWRTGKDGKVKIPTNKVHSYNQILIETGETSKSYKSQKVDLYSDKGVRFLGEVAGTDFITYNKLLSEITGKDENSFVIDKCIDDPSRDADSSCGGLGAKLSEGNDSTTGGNWLKIYDARVEKTLYIAKKPLTNYVR